MNLRGYKNILFDCDGVVLNSNSVKTSAFRELALPFGELASVALVGFHTENGGLSRYMKIEHFVNAILPAHAIDIMPSEKPKFVRSLLTEFAAGVKGALLECDVADGLPYLRNAIPDVPWFIVSGGDQGELREIFEQRSLDKYFDGGIYGSPEDKFNIIAGLFDRGQIRRPSLFLGDSRLDHQVAAAFGIDFVFVSQWTEFAEWRQYCQRNKIRVVRSIGDLVAIKSGPIGFLL